MADEKGGELPQNPEGNKESIRGLVKDIASKQLRALGYQYILDDARNWLLGNNKFDFITTPGSSESPLDYLSGKLKRIQDPEDAKRLLASALFGVPAEENPEQLTLVKYQVAKESNIIIQTKLDPVRDSKSLTGLKPNEGETKLLIGRIVSETGFLKEGETQLDVIRKLSKGATIEIANRDNFKLRLRLTSPKRIPEIAESPRDWAYKVEIYILK